MNADQVQVLIVGAGPVGLTMACESRRLGLSCRIIEEREEPTPLTESRALALWERTLEVFDNLGISEEVAAAAKKIHGLNAYSGGRRLAHISLDLEGADTPYPFTLSLPQGQTERILAARLRSLCGEVERPWRLTNLRQDDQGVTATLAGPDGREQIVRSGWLVGCDGAHSTVRHRLGLSFEGNAYDEAFRIADVRLDWDLPDDEGHFFVPPKGEVVAAFPVPGEGRWRLINASPVEETIDASQIVAHFQELLRANGHPRVSVTDVTWATAFHIQRRITDRFRVGHCFVAGDAAHIHSPAGGQGLNTGVQDAANLAWKLALVAAGAAPETLLDTYEAERRPVAQSVLHGTDLLTRAVILRHPVAVSIRNTLASFLGQFDFVRRRIARSMSELDVEYRRSPIVADDHGSLLGALLTVSGPRPGDRAPDVQLGTSSDDPPRRLFEVLRDTRHTLLLFLSGSRTAEVNRSITAIGDLIRERYRPWINTYLVVQANSHPESLRWEGGRLLDHHGHFQRRFGGGAGCLYLIRPDGYVGYRSQPPDAGKLAAYLGRLFQEAEKQEKLVNS